VVFDSSGHFAMDEVVPFIIDFTDNTVEDIAN
jgi:hypothetical protein